MGGASCPALAAAVSNAGGLGMIAASWTEGDDLRSLVRETKEMTSAPFGLNLVLEWDQRERLGVLLEEGARVVSYFWSALEPGSPYVEEAHQAGALVMLTVGSAEEARRAVDAGVDVVVAQGLDAGGHVWGGVGTMSLIPAVVDAVAPAPVIAAGGIGDGRGLAAGLALGAQAAWMGTAFVVADESRSHPAYKDMVTRASEVDAVWSEGVFNDEWPQAPVRTLDNSTLRAWRAAGSPPPGERPGEGDVIATMPGGDPIPRYSVSNPTEEMTGEFEAMALYAGQSAALVRRRRPAAEIVEELLAQAAATIGRLPAT